MQHLHFSTVINAPREKVWHTMLDDKTYREWTKVFSPNCWYKGSWDKGSKILFLGTDKDGKNEGGMVSRIAENRLHEFMSIEHLGFVAGGKEITEGKEVEAWKGAHENYTLTDKDGGTELTVDLDTADSEKDSMKALWEKALPVLKELAEK